MNNKKTLLACIISCLILTTLFIRESFGLNLLIYESLLLTLFVISKTICFQNKLQITISIGVAITALSTILTNSILSILINLFSLALFIGIIIYPKAHSLITAMLLSAHSFYNSQLKFIRALFDFIFGESKIGSIISRARIFIIPIPIIIIFFGLYSASNPYFTEAFQNIFDLIENTLNYLIGVIDFQLVFTFLASLVLSNFIFFRVAKQNIIASDAVATDDLKRVKLISRNLFKLNNLKNEYKSAVFLTLCLNSILLVLNIIDINSVWFNFSWQGQYLKEFVHEGTYLLIISIVISILLVLRFFRGNLNFYSNNKLLKILCYLWLFQNGILAISVGVRNFWYIHYFSLASKRIAVIVFLLLTLFGLYSVFIKVLNRKSLFYITKTNTYACYIMIVFCSMFNWDNIIANYNFKNSNKAFLHFDYMVTLSDNSLPYLDKSLSELQNIEMNQKINFPFEQKYMSTTKYHEIIEHRKLKFKKKWEAKGILSWNLPEYLAYKKLFEKKN